MAPSCISAICQPLGGHMPTVDWVLIWLRFIAYHPRGNVTTGAGTKLVQWLVFQSPVQLDFMEVAFHDGDTVLQEWVRSLFVLLSMISQLHALLIIVVSYAGICLGRYLLLDFMSFTIQSVKNKLRGDRVRILAWFYWFFHTYVACEESCWHNG